MTAAALPAVAEPASPPGEPDAGRFGGGEPVPCRACLRRTWLVGELAGRIEHAARARGARRIALLLALDDHALMRAVDAGDDVAAAYRRFERDAALEAADAAGLAVVCRHDARYPACLHRLPDAPAALHVAGRLERFERLTEAGQPAVAIVGARRGSSYGLEVARALGRGLAAADVTVVSGMALGVDSAAHAGALEASGAVAGRVGASSGGLGASSGGLGACAGPAGASGVGSAGAVALPGHALVGAGGTVAVLAGGADRPYPASKRRLYEAIREHGCVVSELGPGVGARRWCFPARNRIIAGLARLTIVVEAMARSGSLITAELARELGRDVGAVPGPVTSPLSTGPNALLADGAHVVCGPEDALDLACGVGSWARRVARPAVPEHLAGLHAAVAAGAASPEALAQLGVPIAAALAGLAELELLGLVRRTAGGRYEATA